MGKVLFDGESDFGRYQIVEQVYHERLARVLFSGDALPQSGVALDDDPELLFSYNQRFLEIALSVMPKSILVIGGGAFTLPKALLERFAGATIDVVEIDPLLPELARTYFDLPSSSKLNVIVADGREFVEGRKKKYDLIILDAFSGHEIPRSLMSVNAAAQYTYLLASNGIIAMNFIAPYQHGRISLADRLIATFRTKFTDIELYPADPHESPHSKQNYVLVVAKKRIPSLDYLQSASAQLYDGDDAHLVMTD